MEIKQRKTKHCLIFTDLDGTLLDQDTYKFDEAGEALLYLKNNGIPLILCSSKTRMEIEALRQELDNHYPFITENGAAIYIPRGLFGRMDFKYKEKESFEIVELGLPYEKILIFWKEIKQETGIPATGFSEMSADQIAQVSGLTLEKAALAKNREYSEPFLLTEEITGEQWSLLEKAVQKRGLTLTRGGRFYHLTGLNDKGKAVLLLIELYQKTKGSIISIGLGNSFNDFPMLANVDIPVLIKKKNGQWASWPLSKLIFRTQEIGPEGWNAFILKLLKENCHE